MNWDRLKNRIQQDASKKEVKVDVDEIWAAIEPAVDDINNERRKKRFFFFWLVGLGFVLALSSIYFINNKNTSDAKLVNFEKMEKTTSEHDHEHFHSHSHSHDVHEVDTEAKKEQHTSNHLNNNEKDFSKKEKEINFRKNTPSHISSKEQIETDKLSWNTVPSSQNSKSINDMVNSDLIFSKNKSSDKFVGRELLNAPNPISDITLNLQITERVLLSKNNISSYYTALTKEEIEKILSENQRHKDRLLKRQREVMHKYSFHNGQRLKYQPVSVPQNCT